MDMNAKEYKQGLTLMDDYFMNLCLKNCIPCTQVMINIILDRKDIHVNSVETQKFFQGFGRSLQVDVYAKDESGKRYNIEVQNADDGADPRRARFHGSMMDVHLLDPGQEFKELPETYVIFITRNDVLGFGDMLYQIDRYIGGKNERFNDGQHIIYVNCSAAEDGSNLWKLIHDMNCSDPNEMFIPELAERTGYFLNTQEGEIEMNSYFEKIMEKREEARVHEERCNIALNLLKKGKMTLEEIAECAELALAEVSRLAYSLEWSK